MKKSSKPEAKRKTFRLRARNVKGKRYDLILLKVFFGGCKAVRKYFRVLNKKSITEVSHELKENKSKEQKNLKVPLSDLCSFYFQLFAFD